MTDLVVVGNGPVAHRLVEQLSERGHQGTITVLGSEPRPAYNRALLTNLLDGTLEPEVLTLPLLAPRARVRIGVTATGIDRAARLVCADDGEIYRYDKLILATGARPRIPDVPGVVTGTGQLAAGACPLWTIADCGRITGNRVVVLGGGVLGVEAACALRRAGREVSLVHPGPYPMDRHLDGTGGRLLAAQLMRLGVSTHLERTAVEYRPGALMLDDGQVLDADTLLLATGSTPDTGLARDAGLLVGTGVLVDDLLRTSDPRIHAIGDCAEHRGAQPGHLGRGWEQADVLARLLTGGGGRYSGSRTVLRARITGTDVAVIGSPDHTDGELVTLSDRGRGRHARLLLRDRRITAATLIGLPEATATIGRLYEQNRPVPSDALALLLGTTPGRAGTVELPGHAVICSCNNVTKDTLIHAWRRGCRDLPSLAEATRATTGCGRCVSEVRRVRDSMEAA
ncbi:FAD-dependent oxidoreductase [Kibdelosporangium aridum]|uniref:FAD-dependent oxidoreductase n=1 Tax=Kibdelosporangium aridum TaxID=2030 RepID=UPI0035E6FA26